MSFTHKDISSNLYFILLLIISIGISLQIVIYKIGIILLFLYWLFFHQGLKKITRVNLNKELMVLVLFYFFYCLSFFWSLEKDFAKVDLILKSPLLILPLILGTIKLKDKKQYNYILLSFAYSSLAINFYCFFKALPNYFSTLDLNVFYYSNLTINMHTAYQSLFTCFSILILFYINLNNKKTNKYVIVIIPIQMLFVLLLASRMQILIMIFFVSVFFIYKYYKKQKTWAGLLITTIYLLIVGQIISAPSALNYRYKQTISQVSMILDVGEKVDLARKDLWREALNVIKQNIIIGTGVGDAKKNLLTKMEKYIVNENSKNEMLLKQINILKKDKKRIEKLTRKAKLEGIKTNTFLQNYALQLLEKKSERSKFYIAQQYNYHNQYLQTFATIGIIGISLLIFILFFPIKNFFLTKNYFEIFFLLLIVLSFITESFLERQAGVSFFAFFYSLLVANSKINSFDSTI